MTESSLGSSSNGLHSLEQEKKLQVLFDSQMMDYNTDSFVVFLKKMGASFHV